MALPNHTLVFIKKVVERVWFRSFGHPQYQYCPWALQFLLGKWTPLAPPMQDQGVMNLSRKLKYWSNAGRDTYFTESSRLGKTSKTIEPNPKTCFTGLPIAIIINVNFWSGLIEKKTSSLVVIPLLKPTFKRPNPPALCQGVKADLGCLFTTDHVVKWGASFRKVWEGPPGPAPSSAFDQ